MIVMMYKGLIDKAKVRVLGDGALPRSGFHEPTCEPWQEALAGAHF